MTRDPDDPIVGRLDRWVDAGLLARDQADRILRFEAEQGEPPESDAPTTYPAAAATARTRGSAAEAVGYVGAALALGALALLVGDLWYQLVLGGRLALVGVVTAAAFGGGLALVRSPSAPLQRLTSVLFAATVAGVGGFVAVLGEGRIDGGVLGLSTALAMVSVAIPLYLWRRRLLPQLAALVPSVFAAAAALDLSPLDPGAGWFGLVIATVGAAWFLLAVGGWLPPRRSAELTGGLVVLLGVQVAAFGSAPAVALTLGLLLAGALVVLAVLRDEVHQLVVGALALFVLAPQLVFELFGDAIGAPATLLLVGLLLVLLAVGLGRARKEVRT